MRPALSETIVLDFVTSDSDGVAVDADSMPTAEVFEDATDTTVVALTVTKRTSKTGNYRVPIACTTGNGFEAGKSYNVVASATVGGLAAKRVVGTFQVRTGSVDAANVARINGALTNGSPAIADRPILYLQQLNVHCSIAGEGAIYATNDHATGTGLYLIGEAYGLYSSGATGGYFSGSQYGLYAISSGDDLEHSGIYAKCSGLLGSGIYGEAIQGGHGGWFQAEGTGHGLFTCSLGAGDGLKAQAGTTGIGFEAVGGATSGDGLHARARAGNSDGLQAAKHGTGADFRGDITSTLFTGITSLAQWLGLIAGKQTGNTTARTELRATGAGAGTYDETTDSLQAIKDVGVPATTLPTTPPAGYGTLTITPIQASTSNARISSRKLPPIPQGSAPLDVVNVTDGTGAAVDLSAMTLRMVVALTTDEGEIDDRTDDEIEAIYKYETGDGLTVGGDDDNQISIQHDAANTADVGHFRYWVFNITTPAQPVPLLKGTFDVEPAATDT